MEDGVEGGVEDGAEDGVEDGVEARPRAVCLSVRAETSVSVILL